MTYPADSCVPSKLVKSTLLFLSNSVKQQKDEIESSKFSQKSLFFWKNRCVTRTVHNERKTFIPNIMATSVLQIVWQKKKDMGNSSSIPNLNALYI